MSIPKAAPGYRMTLGFLLREAYEVLQAEIYAAVAADGHPELRDTHSPVLRHLPREGARVVDLSRQAGYAKQSMAYLVEDLLRLGYVSVGPDPTDGRAKLVRLTGRGHDLVKCLLAHSAAAEQRLAQRLGAKAVKTLRTSLTRIAEVR